ncbi:MULTISPECIES: LPS-assembly protein LptD [Nitrosomonas]|uniref:LPS-assembly protein LptD n=1 Tax=Nitrosomonas communis TaxID=44574 RepID=A0A0F7KI93_9PROT|nr:MULTISPECIES: LPS-assembly protein LptD [Nitrosomonas]AKH38579.1 LPS biosynthesis protein [Nitrosomonas communis]TYP93051.1 LPS-assembly protein [Nitrosomonas communis]UVS60640.1 LPS-assembly protein LptD [Nitrosomonas sp. PLL12]
MNNYYIQILVFFILLGSSVVVVAAEQLSGSKKKLPVFIEADEIKGHPHEEVEAIGKAKLQRGDQVISADYMKYLPDTKDAIIDSKVHLEREKDVLEGSHLRLNLETLRGELGQPNYYLKEGGGRGSGNLFLFEGEDHYRLKNGNYTTCPIGNDDWFIRAEDLEIDEEKEVGTARHVRVAFKDVPFLYLPWLNFSYSGKRKTGFLAPVMGNTARSGVEVSLPFYWNIAPNYDATITARAMSKRGIMFENEFRYIGETLGGQALLDILPNDLITNETRYGVFLNHAQYFGKGWSGNVDYNHVSDRDFFRDLGTNVNLTARTNLLQQASTSYNGSLGQKGAISFTTLVQSFQTLQDPRSLIVPPYKRLPQFTLTASQRDVYGLDFDLTSIWTNFFFETQRLPDGQQLKLADGLRLVLFPSVSLPLQTAFGYIKPKVSLHHTRYNLNEPVSENGDSNINRTVPLFSLDSGVVFERDTKFRNENFVQTLEPRIFYLYVPFRNQDNSIFPNFESAEMDFSFAQIFTENRFSGHDRINDANEITLALTSRLIESTTGNERLRLAVGQKVRFSDRDVVLSGQQTTSNKTDFIAAISGKITPMITTDTSVQLDEREFRIEKIRTGVSYHPEPGKVFNLGYRYTRGVPGVVQSTNLLFPVPGAPLEQVDASTQWPFLKNWQGMASVNYSLQDDKLLAGLVGVEYNSCCWTLRMVLNRFITATERTSTAFFVQLELNGLMRVGNNPIRVLRQGIPGYTHTSQQF